MLHVTTQRILNKYTEKICMMYSLAVKLSVTTRTTSRNPLEILPVCSFAVSINRELHLFLIHERPSLQWLSRKHLPSFALQGLVFEQIFLSTRPEKTFQYLITTSIFF
jgi:hypothetical protein